MEYKVSKFFREKINNEWYLDNHFNSKDNKIIDVESSDNKMY